MFKNLTTHLLWVIASLIGVISVVLWKLPNGSQLSGYISFAASIASLVLAIVAIFQSLLSSAGFNASINEIKISAQSIVSETTRLGKASSAFSEEAEAAPRKLETLPDQLASMKGELAGQIEKLDTQNFARLSSETVSGNSDEGKWYAGRPFGYILAIYALALSYKNAVPLNLDTAFSEKELRTIRNYIAGVVTTIKYHQVCGIKVDGVNDFMATSMGTLNATKILADVRDFDDLSQPVKKVINILNLYYKVDWSLQIDEDIDSEDEED